MDINIIAGKCNEQNDKKIFELLKNRDKTKEHIIIAPDRSLFEIERRLFDELNESCFFDVSVMSLTKLSKKIVTKTTKNILTKQSGVALVKKLLIENKSELKSFGKACEYLGFAECLFETICLLKSCNISCSDMVVTDDNTYENLKQKDIKLIYSKYEEFLKNDYTDSFNQLKVFADAITHDFAKDICFYFIEFDDYTALMQLIIGKLARHSNKFYITCTYSADSNNQNIYTNKVYYDLIDLFKFEGLHCNINKLISNDVVVNNLLGYNVVKSENKNDRFEIINFENVEDEISYAIMNIYKLVQTRDINFGDICVVLPSMQTYKNRLKKELLAYNIPYYFDESEMLGDQCLIRTINDICVLINSNFSASDLSHVLKNELLAFDKNNVLIYDKFLKATGRHGTYCFEYLDLNDEKILDFICKVKSWISIAKKESTVSDYLSNIIMPIYDYLSANFDIITTQMTDLEVRTFNQTSTKFLNCVKDYESVFGDNIINFDDFLETMFSYFESTNISLPPITSNTLFIADFESSYITNYKYLYILGNVEGKLPSYKMDNGLVTDDEIARLPNAKQINPTIKLINARKLFKLFDMVMRPTNKVILTYALNSLEGKLYPNNLIKSLTTIFDMDILNGSYVLDLINNSLDKIDVTNLALNNLNKSRMLDNVLLLNKNWKVYSTYPNYREMLNLMVKKLGSEDIIKLLNNNTSVQENIKLTSANMFKNNTTSVSQIETYYQCPYKHFCRYGLRLNNFETSTLKPNDIGTIIHRVLKITMPDMLRCSDIDKILKRADEVTLYVLGFEEYKYILDNPSNSYTIKSLRKEIGRIVSGIIDELRCSSYKPQKEYLEYGFESGELTSRGIKIKGSIDRIDTWGDRFIIIDYKTGDSSFDNYSQVSSGKKLQLLVYAKAFANKTKLKPGGAFYLPISNALKKSKDDFYKFTGVMDGDINNIYAVDNNLSSPGYKSKVLYLSTAQNGEMYKNSGFLNRMCVSSEDMEYLLNFAIKQVNLAVDNIIKGDITPRPLVMDNMSACDKCEFVGLCNYLGGNEREPRNVMTIEDLKEFEKEMEDNGV